MFDKKDSKNIVLIGIAVVAVIVVVVLVYVNPSDGSSLQNSFQNIFGTSSQKIGEETVKYINDKGLSPQGPVSLVSVSEESGMVKIKIKIGSNEFDSYITKDGKFLFPSAPIDMSAADEGSSANNNNTDSTASTSITKNDSPLLEVFVVSRCPYGLQIQRAVADAVKNIPELAQYIKVEYIGAVSGNKITAMHGDAEATENLRQICIREEQSAKFHDYVACQMKTGDIAGCQTSIGIDSAKLNSCVSTASKGIAYAQKDFDQSNNYGVQGSPTIFLNGTKISESDFGGRSSGGVKSMVCAGFNNQPEFCSTKLNTVAAAVGFSETYGSSSATNNSANTNCAPAQ